MADLDSRVTTIEYKLNGIAALLTMPPTNTPHYPADIIDLGNWKLTTPYLGHNGDLIEVTQPQLATYSDPGFCATPDGTAVIFDVHHGAAHTKHSLNPRMELREMLGGKLAAWNPHDGAHLLSVSGYVDLLTTTRPITVLGQVHDGSDDICTFRLEDTKLYRTSGNDTHNALITPTLDLGTLYNLSFVVSGGLIHTYYNSMETIAPLPVPSGADGWYFRAGAYLQSNSVAAPKATPNEHTTVAITHLSVVHS